MVFCTNFFLANNASFESHIITKRLKYIMGWLKISVALNFSTKWNNVMSFMLEYYFVEFFIFLLKIMQVECEFKKAVYIVIIKVRLANLFINSAISSHYVDSNFFLRKLYLWFLETMWLCISKLLYYLPDWSLLLPWR